MSVHHLCGMYSSDNILMFAYLSSYVLLVCTYLSIADVVLISAASLMVLKHIFQNEALLWEGLLCIFYSCNIRSLFFLMKGKNQENQ